EDDERALQSGQDRCRSGEEGRRTAGFREVARLGRYLGEGEFAQNAGEGRLRRNQAGQAARRVNPVMRRPAKAAPKSVKPPAPAVPAPAAPSPAKWWVLVAVSAVVSAAVLIPCFWQSRIQAG